MSTLDENISEVGCSSRVSVVVTNRSDGSSPDPAGVVVSCGVSVVVRIEISALVVRDGRELAVEKNGVDTNTVALPELTKSCDEKGLEAMNDCEMEGNALRVET